MWHNDKNVTRTYATSGGQNAWAIISDIAGWKRIKTGAADGVTNVFLALCDARANNRKVRVYIEADEITRVILM